MHKKKTEKKIPELEPFFDSILVCDDKKIRPFIEILVQEPENIAQHNLGTLLGVFSVEELSEDSSYIANYLISVIRKEYFSRAKRPPIESFEAALHKANLALSKLAEHENVKWIGKLNAIIAVIEKNNLHITQAGKTSAFLLRVKGLTDISEGLASEEPEPHPLKTFVNVSSGRLEEGDKIIIATNEIFNIFSLEEIKKSALRFSNEKFVQFLRTALTNELEKAAVLVTEIRQKRELATPATKKNEDFNAFSQSAFQRQAPTKNAEPEKNAEPTKEKTEQKNGHIYIKEGSYPEAESSRLKEYSVILGEWLETGSRKIVRAGKNIFAKLSTITLPKIQLPKTTPPLEKKDMPLPEIFEAETPPKSQTPSRPPFQEKAKIFFTDAWKKISAIFRLLLPDFTKLKAIAGHLNRQQKIYASLIVLAIVFVPLFALRLQKYIQNKNTPAPVAIPEIIIPLANDKNVIRLENLETPFSAEGLLTVLNLNDRIFAVSQGQISDAQNREFFAIPESFGKIALAAKMDDLNLIFLLNENRQILAFSPTAKKFQPNNISIPDQAQIAAASSYLTYLYLVDRQNSQIYRYPRAEGGFGASANWLKDSLDLSQTSGLALSDNIFLADEKTIIKLFKGKKQDFTLEATATPIVPFKVHTQPDSQNIFVLDKQNARVIKLDTGGVILNQYYNAEIANANDFTVDEKNNLIYLSTFGALKSLPLN